MSAVILVDTSVFLNVLDVPGFNQDRSDVLTTLQAYLETKANLLLLMAAVFEAGNHIAQLPDGRNRRSAAERFVYQLTRALDGDAPWVPTPLPNRDQLRAWLPIFPDSATRGEGLGDLSIIKEWTAACTRHPDRRVRIWSLDKHLTGYDRQP